jgi:MFS family permease
MADELSSRVTSEDVSKCRGWHLLASRDFGLLWSGQLVSQIGDGLNRVALLWFVYALTGSALKMAVIGLLQTLPAVLLSPVIGVYLDRMQKKWVMIWIDLVRTVLIFLIPVLHSIGALTLERLYVMVLLIAIASTIFGPALSSAVPLIVSRPRLTAANALMQGGVNIAVLIGPAMSGLGIATIGVENVLFINAAGYLISALCLLPIRIQQAAPGPAVASCPPSVLSDMLAGFRFVFLQERTVPFLLITVASFNLAWNGFLFLLPAVAQHVLDVGPLELGMLWSLLGGGMLATSAWLAWVEQGDMGCRMRMIAGSMAVSGLAIWGLKFFGSASLAIPLIIIIGGCIAPVTPIVWALLQEMTPQHMLARVFTTFSTGVMSAAMAGMVGFGWAMDQLGSGITLLGIGVTFLATALAAAHFSRRLKPVAVVISQAA